MSFSMFTKLLTSNRSIQGSGYNLEGQLDNDKQNYELNVTNLSIKNVSAMDKSVYHSIYLLKTGEVKGVGNNKYGQLGIGNLVNQMFPITIPLNNVEQVSCGGYHTVYLTRDNTIYVTGHNEYGQLGLGHKNLVDKLTILNLPNVERIVCGGYCTFFIMTDGTVKTCGRNDYGQLGLGDTTDRLTPVTLPLINIKEIYCGGDYTFFKMTDDTIKACGYNGYGQLGLGDTTDRTTPTNINITDVNKIECSAHHTLFLKYDKTVYGCGHNGYGQLGLDNWEHQYSIIKLLIDDVSNILADSYSSFFLINRMLIKGCGHNGYGELALGDTVNRNKITVLNFKNLWDDNYSDDIAILPPFDMGKNVFVAEGYFMGKNNNYCFILDKDLILRVYLRNGMIPYDKTYLYIKDREVQFSKIKTDVINSNNTRKYNIDPMYTCGDTNCTTDNIFYFSINNVILQYNVELKTVIKVKTEEKICTSISNDLFFFDNKISKKDSNSNINTVKTTSSLIGSENSVDINIDKYTKFVYKKDTGYFIDNNLNILKTIVFDSDITCCLFTSGGRLFIGSKNGFLYNFKTVSDIDNISLYKKYDQEISFLKIKENKNVIDKTLLIDDHGSFLIIGFTDGGYIKDTLYPMPEISISCNDINFIDGKAFYHMKIRLLNDSVFYENMELLVHNKYNDEIINYSDLDENKSLTRIIGFNTTNLGLFSNLRLNYLFGNNSLGTIYTQVCNVKNNLIYKYLDKVFINISNYTNTPCNLILEKVELNGTKTTLQTLEISNILDYQFISFDEFLGLDKFNLKLIQNGIEYYLEENIQSNIITLDGSIKNINNEGDILNDYSWLFNKIYENKNLSDIPLNDIVTMLNKLSHKKVGKTEILEPLRLDDKVKNDVFGNATNFLADKNNHYLMTFQPENIYKDMRYRSNIFINGRKIPYNDVYNLLNTGNSQMLSYFNDRNIEKSTNNYVEGNIYEESLISGETELHKINITNWEHVDKLLKGEFYFVVDNISEYIDIKKMSLYIKFRQGSFYNRITLNDYNLEMVERNDSYYKFKIQIRDQVLCRIGNEIHITLNDLDKETSIIFKDMTKNTNKKYKNYFVPLISLNETGSIINYYIEKSEHIEVFVNGYTMIPYIDYKVVNYPLHLQLPSMVVFKSPVKTDVKIEISILKENYIDSIVKKKSNDKFIIENLDENIDTTFIPLLYNTYDKFIDNIKVPNLEEDGKSIDIYSKAYYDRKYEYIKFYLENNTLVRFLITLLRLKMKTETITKPNNIGNVTKTTFNPVKTNYNIYEDDSNEGLIYFLLELFDNAISKDEKIIIDCNDEKQVHMDTDILLDSNMKFSLPYIEENLKLNCNYGYNKNEYVNNIL